MKIKNIIFDVGNVIVRWSPTQIVKEAFPGRGSHQHQFIIESIFRSEIWIELNLGKITEEDAKLKFISKLDFLDMQSADKLFNHIKSTQELIPGTVDIIKTLHKNGYRLFALTDNIKEIIHYLENKYDFWQYFTHTTVSANIGLMKPSKEIFEFTIQKNALLPQETVFIDDHLPNIKAANLLGLHTILFSDSVSCSDELKKKGVNVAEL